MLWAWYVIGVMKENSFLKDDRINFFYFNGFINTIPFIALRE